MNFGAFLVIQIIIFQNIAFSLYLPKCARIFVDILCIHEMGLQSPSLINPLFSRTKTHDLALKIHFYLLLPCSPILTAHTTVLSFTPPCSCTCACTPLHPHHSIAAPPRSSHNSHGCRPRMLANLHSGH